MDAADPGDGSPPLITNDADLLDSVRIVRKELGLVVWILNSHGKASRVLAREASFVKQIQLAALRASSFPTRLTRATVVGPATGD
jgi:hypothetical protein